MDTWENSPELESWIKEHRRLISLGQCPRPIFVSHDIYREMVDRTRHYDSFVGRIENFNDRLQFRGIPVLIGPEYAEEDRPAAVS